MSKQRPCWSIDTNEGLAGLIIYKDESRTNPQDSIELDSLNVPGNKILKLCLFKIDENQRGEKFGEQLLKKAMDYAYKNNYDTTYLTVYPKHKLLIELLERFGFIQCGNNGNEHVYFKYTKVIDNPIKSPQNSFEFHKIFWPCINVNGVNFYIVPIFPEFHARLFPEADRSIQKQLSFDLNLSSQIPGNALRKTYICNAPLKSMNKGDVLFFYRTVDSIITSVGILEDYTVTTDFTELKRLVGKRSVYTDIELGTLLNKATPAKVMNFYYSQNLNNFISRQKLLDNGILGKGQPQTITPVSLRQFDILFNLLSKLDNKLFYK